VSPRREGSTGTRCPRTFHLYVHPSIARRESIIETVKKIAVHPIERLEQRVGALEQDIGGRAVPA
jgi:hypothetical protein